MKKILSIILVGLCSYINAQDFEVTPLKLFFNAEPGESQTKFIRVKNHSSGLETFILNISDLQIDSKGKSSYVEAGSLKQSVMDWISIAPSFFELNPNEEKEIAITMQQPADNVGSKWGVIFVRTAQEQSTFSADKMSAGLSVGGRIAISVYQTPGTNTSYKATIANLNEISMDSDSVRTYTALVNNLEDIITPCKVFLIATNIETAEETTFEEYIFTMYPKSSRKVELYMPRVLPKGTYSVAAILDYGNNANLEGTQMIIQVE